jgi:hypothetical protein
MRIVVGSSLIDFRQRYCSGNAMKRCSSCSSRSLPPLGCGVFGWAGQPALFFERYLDAIQVLGQSGDKLR